MSALTIRNFNLETEALEPATLTFEVAVDPTAMTFSYQGKPLAAHGDTVLFAAGSTLEFKAPAGYTLSAQHEDEDGEPANWSENAGDVSFEFASASTDAFEVSVTATPSTETTDPPKKKIIRTHPKPGGALPDPELEAPEEPVPAPALEARLAALEAKVAEQEARIAQLEQS